MKKILSLLGLLILSPMLVACEISNTDLANSLEGNMTRLVYSVGYLDSISTEELSNIVNNSSYFTHSSLYTNSTATVTENDNINLTTTDNLTTNSALQGGLKNNSVLSASANPYRTRTYKSSILNNASVSGTDDVTTNVGVVDMSLLETSSADLNNILLEISSKRGIIMLYCTDLRSGRATLSANDKSALNEYDNIIQETTNYLNNTSGALHNQFNGIASISTAENSAELINAKLIRANEVLKTRYAKLDTCLDALDAIINILVNSIGFEYISMYQATAPNTIAPNTNDTTSSISVTETPTIDNNSTPNILENSTSQNSSSTICPICKQSVCICNNSSSRCPVCNQEVCICKNSNSETYETPNTSNNTSDNTIINYNYDGENSSAITTPSASTYPINRPQRETITNEITNSSNLTETEIALNGGLVKNVNNDIINDKNSNNYILSSSPSPGELTKDHKTDPNLNSYTYPFKTLEETSHNFPINEDLRDEEFIESEKELTPEILPFSGVNQSNTREIQSLKNSNLGYINLLPFQYEEDNVLKKIPRQ